MTTVITKEGVYQVRETPEEIGNLILKYHVVIPLHKLNGEKYIEYIDYILCFNLDEIVIL